ncbi:hypothetical protein Q5424_24815 [Conexibacter sp. JD483]|uniref:hypothetical protein n=1 Tax=unclassified Conexibacter TaxID=2627773 RepID=UPI002718C904|nr:MULTISPECIES: hypothetical protein [unclassified Conexibacter]MDO8188438.1 hypothetical protein [Conexibacter sp. CPCC 205706]MDO8199201.1 hypothetical protein [Conexibacter sp. CPCC 205762]MDR9372345.1 hypothetical protein [Conexibacter sp. JD483]
MSKLVITSVAIALSAVTAAVAAPAASAARLATPEERAAIVATDGRPAACLTVTVSTVQDGWALISDVDSAACASEGRPSIVTFTDGAWKVFYSGEDLPDASCDDIAVPRAVGEDLEACDPVDLPPASAEPVPQPQPRPAPRLRNCGNFDGSRWTSLQIQGAGIFGVTARRTDCRFARWLSLHAFDSLRKSPGRGGRWRVRAWTCRLVDSGYEYGSIRCRASGDRMVAWESGA